MQFTTRLKQGDIYLKSWPNIKQLSLIFPEVRIIKATQFAIKFMPFLAAFAIVWQQIYAPHDTTALVLAIITALVALGLPIQGLSWLGKRATTTLSPITQNWYDKIAQQLEKEFNISTTLPSNHQPNYQDLANLLNKAKEHLPNDFWQEI